MANPDSNPGPLHITPDLLRGGLTMQAPCSAVSTVAGWYDEKTNRQPNGLLHRVESEG